MLKHTGRAVVFRDYNDMAARLDADDLHVTPDSMLVLQNCGPLGGPCMPEWGMLLIPKKLLKQGVREDGSNKVGSCKLASDASNQLEPHLNPSGNLLSIPSRPETLW